MLRQRSMASSAYCEIRSSLLMIVFPFYCCSPPGAPPEASAGARRNNAFFQDLAAKALAKRHAHIMQELSAIEQPLRALVRKSLS